MKIEFRNMSVRRKLAFLPLLLLAGLGALQITNSAIESLVRKNIVLKDFSEQALNAHRRTLKATVDVEAISLGEQLKACKTKEEKNAVIIAATDATRFFDDQSGYFFAVQFDGVRVNVPIDKSRNGQNTIGDKDVNGFGYAAEFCRVAKAGGGFVSYVYTKPGKGAQPKLSYIRPIPGTEILIGAGVYIDNVEEETRAMEARIAAQRTKYVRFAYAICLLAAALAFTAVWGVGRSIRNAIKGVSDEMLANSHEVAAVAGEVSSGSQRMAEAATEQASSLEETNAALEELASRTRENAANIQKVNDLSRQTLQAAEKGTSDVQAMIAGMDGIRESSHEIAKIIKTIDEIAFQTNILALNAAVEAARAGEAGMGFSVVAEEVRNLAQRSATAAHDTSTKIEGAIAKAAQGGAICDTVANGLREILAKAREVNALATLVAQASEAQSQGIDQVNTATRQLDQTTQCNAAFSEESASASTELNAQAAALEKVVGRLAELLDGQGAHIASTPPPQTHAETQAAPAAAHAVRTPIARKPARLQNIAPGLRKQ
jgi:methyl-accepting chemotaxis protein